MSIFHERLRFYRERLGITAKEFAAQIGIKYSTYSGYEAAGKEPRYDTMIQIAEALHVSLDELFGYTLPYDVASCLERINQTGEIVASIEGDAVIVKSPKGRFLFSRSKEDFLADMKIIETAINGILRAQERSLTPWAVHMSISNWAFLHTRLTLQEAATQNTTKSPANDSRA